jgi:hypothetical protein
MLNLFDMPPALIATPFSIAMANLITFRSTTILADGEGVFSNPQWEEAAGQEYAHEPLARGLGTVAKQLGTRQASITLTVTFFTKDSGGNTITTYQTRLSALAAVPSVNTAPPGRRATKGNTSRRPAHSCNA